MDRGISDDDLKRAIRRWSHRLHIPVTRMMSRVLREEIEAARARRLAGQPEPIEELPPSKAHARDLLRARRQNEPSM